MEASVQLAEHFRYKRHQPMDIFLRFTNELLRFDRGVPTLTNIPLVRLSAIVFKDVAAVEHHVGKVNIRWRLGV